MELRAHPLMCYGGLRNWPPVWIAADPTIGRVIAGEVGILRHIEYNARYNTRCLLLVEYDGEIFIGMFRFDDIAFCSLFANTLKNHTSRSVGDIGRLDFLHTP